MSAKIRAYMWVRSEGGKKKENFLLLCCCCCCVWCAHLLWPLQSIATHSPLTQERTKRVHFLLFLTLPPLVTVISTDRQKKNFNRHLISPLALLIYTYEISIVCNITYTEGSIFCSPIHTSSHNLSHVFAWKCYAWLIEKKWMDGWLDGCWGWCWICESNQ